MGILDGIVDWLATQVMNFLDLASTSVLGALGCNMDTFKRYFPAASAMYEIFIWTAIGLVLLNLVWQLYRCYGAGFDIDTENPINLVVRSVIFLLLIWYCDDIVNLALQIGGTPYNWILDSSLPGVQFGDFNSVLLVIIGVIANGSVALIALILVMVLAWNYLKLLLEAAERYVVLGVLVFTAPLAFAFGLQPPCPLLPCTVGIDEAFVQQQRIAFAAAGDVDRKALDQKAVAVAEHAPGLGVATEKAVQVQLRRIVTVVLHAGGAASGQQGYTGQ